MLPHCAHHDVLKKEELVGGPSGPVWLGEDRGIGDTVDRDHHGVLPGAGAPGRRRGAVGGGAAIVGGGGVVPGRGRRGHIGGSCGPTARYG